jgi:hypothetical protein
MLFYNPPLTGKRGRPRLPQCKRGHDRVPSEKSCIACRRYRERVKYETNSAFRGKKKTYQAEYRAAFITEHGYGVHCL